MTGFACLGMLAGGVQLGQFGGSRTLVRYTIEVGLSAPAPYAEVHVAVWTNVDVGQSQGPIAIGDELPFFTDIRGSMRFEVDLVHGGEGPVADKESIPVMGWECSFGTRDYAGRATGPDVDDRANGVGEVFAPLLGSCAPTAFTP